MGKQGSFETSMLEENYSDYDTPRKEGEVLSVLDGSYPSNFSCTNGIQSWKQTFSSKLASDILHETFCELETKLLSKTDCPDEKSTLCGNTNNIQLDESPKENFAARSSYTDKLWYAINNLANGARELKSIASNTCICLSDHLAIIRKDLSDIPQWTFKDVKSCKTDIIECEAKMDQPVIEEEIITKDTTDNEEPATSQYTEYADQMAKDIILSATNTRVAQVRTNQSQSDVVPPNKTVNVYGSTTATKIMTLALDNIRLRGYPDYTFSRNFCTPDNSDVPCTDIVASTVTQESDSTSQSSFQRTNQASKAQEPSVCSVSEFADRESNDILNHSLFEYLRTIQSNYIVVAQDFKSLPNLNEETKRLIMDSLGLSKCPRFFCILGLYEDENTAVSGKSKIDYNQNNVESDDIKKL